MYGPHCPGCGDKDCKYWQYSVQAYGHAEGAKRAVRWHQGRKAAERIWGPLMKRLRKRLGR